jgi:hypothetical protein
MHARRAALEALDEPGAPSSEPVSLKPSDLELLDPASLPTLVEKLPAIVPTLKPPPVQPAAPPLVRAIIVPRGAPAKKPSLILEQQELQDPPELPDPATRRRPSVGPSAAVSVTPPAASPQEAQPQRSLPPPTIVPENAAPMLEAYRRQMPTFPTFDEAVLPKRRGALQGMVIAGAITVTFAAGWWLGRAYAPVTEPSTCPSTTIVAATQGPPAPSLPSSVPTTVATVPAPSATAGTTEPAVSTSPAVSAAAPTTPAWSTPTATPHSTAASVPAPSAAAPKPAPTATPKPSATHGGFVPEEL